jgi:hypothetical protein
MGRAAYTAAPAPQARDGRSRRPCILALFCMAAFPPDPIGFVSHVCSWASTTFGVPPSGGSGAAPNAKGDVGSAGQTLGTSSLLSAIPAFGAATLMAGPSIFASLRAITIHYYVDYISYSPQHSASNNIPCLGGIFFRAEDGSDKPLRGAELHDLGESRKWAVPTDSLAAPNHP